MNMATCPGCGATYDVTGRPAGHRLTCPGCRGEIVVPEPVPEFAGRDAMRDQSWLEE